MPNQDGTIAHAQLSFGNGMIMWVVLGFADTARYACIVGTFGGKVLGIVHAMTTNFLRLANETDLIAHVRIIRRGKHSIYLEAWLLSDGDTEPVAHVTATAAVRQSAES